MEENGKEDKGGGSSVPVIREMTVTDPTGFHCLPAGQIARIAMDFRGTIEVERDGRRADAGSVMQLLALLAVPDKNVKFRVIINGKDPEAAIEGIEKALRGEISGAAGQQDGTPPQQPKQKGGWAHYLTSLIPKRSH
ncbi:MAG: HPr family phosphocarrier protein [bacterium]